MKYLICIIIYSIVPWSWCGAQHAHDVEESGVGNLRFMENKGQWESQVLFKARLNGGALFLEKDRWTFNFIDHDVLAYFDRHDHQPKTPPEFNRSHAYQMIFDGANPDVTIKKALPFNTYYNYYIGNDPSKWASGVHAYGKVIYENLYPGIDLEILEQDGHLKYNFYVEPGADPSIISISYIGADGVRIDDEDLLISLTTNEVREHQPRAYLAGEKPVECAFTLNGNRMGFILDADYDRTLPLIIDPTLTFASYSGSTADNWGMTATYDNQGHMYAGGISDGAGYPVTLGVAQNSFAGGPWDVSISKFDLTGSNLIYSTYLGGTGTEVPQSMIVNSQHELYVYGSTSSSNFPITTGAFDNTFGGGSSVSYSGIPFTGGSDIYVSKFNSNGTTLLGSTYVGGSANDGLNEVPVLAYNYADQFRGEIILDNSENPIIASSTSSSNFPVTAGVFQPAKSTGQDGCLFKLNSNLTAMTWSTFFGSTGVDAGFGLVVDGANNIYLTGSTTSPGLTFPGPSAQAGFGGGSSDGYILKVNPSGTAKLNGTYIGTSGTDLSYLIQMDDQNRIYITGLTTGLMAASPGVYSNANSGQFIIRYPSNLSGISLRTVFGKSDGNPELVPSAFLVDQCQNIYFSGWGGNTNQFTAGAASDFNIAGLPLSNASNPPYKSNTDGSDFYFFVLSKDMAALEYATYFGGNTSHEHVDGGTSRFDDAGIIYQAVCAGCGGNSDFPTTPGAWSKTNNNLNCNMGVIKFEFQLDIAKAVALASPATVGCAPFSVNFSNTGSFGISFRWDFGDGDSSSQASPNHLFTDTGTFQVQLIAFDTTTCVSYDTTTLEVHVQPAYKINAAIAGDPLTGCAPLEVEFTNTGDTQLIYSWDFGDGGTSTQENPMHTYTTLGNYQPLLIVQDTGLCGIDDTAMLNISVNDGAIADFTGSPVFPMVSTPVSFTNNSFGASQYLWDFGDGSTSNDENPDHAYSQPGTYTVCLFSMNAQDCNDSICKEIRIFEIPYLAIPTAFTPNGDGLNDEYKIIAEGYLQAELKLFNRWGELVWQTDDITQGWNGEYKGTDQDMAVFAYVLLIDFPNQQTQIHKGNVTLIR